MIAAMTRSRPDELVGDADAAKAKAWAEYLEATRGARGVRYEEVEPWAWGRLRARLRAIRARSAQPKRERG